MKPFHPLILVTLLVAWLPAQAATLHDVLEAAWEADSEWSAARNTWEAEQQTRVQGRAALLPNVSAQYSWLENDRKNSSSAFSGTIDQSFQTETTTLRLLQPLFRPAAWYGYRGAAAITSVAEAQFQEARQNFLLRVSEQYFNVLRAWENLDAARAEERAIARQLEQTRERFEVGLVPITDVHEAEAAYDLSQVALIVADADFGIARDRLEALTDRSWDTLATLRAELPLAGPDPEDPQEWVSRARENNPVILAALRASDAARYESRSRLSDQLPTVDFVAQHQRAKTDGEFIVGGTTLVDGESEQRTNSYGIEINLSLFQGGALNSRRKQAALQASASQDQYRQTWRDVGQQTLALHRTVKADLLRVRARSQAIRSAESALRATESGYEVGTRNIVDVLNAQRLVFNARRDYANARYDYIINSLTLKALAGQLDEQDLVAVNEWLTMDNAVELDQPALD